MSIVEYNIGFTSDRMLIIQEFDRTTGKTTIYPLVIKDDRIYVEEAPQA